MVAHSANQLAAMLDMPSTQLKEPVMVRNAYMYIYTINSDTKPVLPRFHSHGNTEVSGSFTLLLN